MEQLTVEIKESAFHCEQSNRLSPLHHLHKDIEIIYVRDGQSTAYVDDRVVNLSTGDLLLVCPNQTHYYENTLEGVYQILIFSYDILLEMQSLFRNYLPVENVFHLSPDSFPVGILNELAVPNHRYQNTRQIGLINCLIAELLSPVELQPHPGFNDKTIKAILSYCEQNYNKDITLHQMAEDLHLNKTYVSRIFNQKIHRNFKTYINALRITKSCELLRDTEEAISDISETVGFGSFRTFNRAFFHIMSMTPSAYRKSAKYVL